ncbi:MAG: IS3 family transposase [Acidimicrobiales bacterium]
MTRYRWIAARRAEGFPVRLCCRVLEVAPSTYYDWRNVHGAGATERELDEAYLVNAIIAVHDSLDDSYGSPRLTHELRHDRCVNHKRVERIVREHGLYAKDARRRKCRTTIPDGSAPPMPDLIQRHFSVGEPGLRTCGDITYLPTGEGWLFLAGVLDFGSRRCLGYSMDERMPAELVGRALTMAADTRGGDVEGMVFHHDRGSQYTSREFRELCDRLGVRQSVGRTGSCHDNAVAESFWATLKREMVSRCRFETRAEARRVIVHWINHYNGLRQHSSINNLSPIEWELQFARRQFQAA